MRIFDVAKAVGIDGRLVAERARAIGVRAPSVASSVPDEMLDALLTELGQITPDQVAQSRAALQRDADDFAAWAERDDADRRRRALDADRNAAGGALVSVPDAARETGVPAATIRQWIKRGKLEAFADPYQHSPSTEDWDADIDRKIRRLVYVEEVRSLAS